LTLNRETIHLLLVYGLTGNAEEAQAVKDRHLETTHLGEGRVDVQRTIMGQPSSSSAQRK